LTTRTLAPSRWTAATTNTLLSPLPPATGRAGLRGAIASEFTKIRSVRSTYWTLAALLVVSVGNPHLWSAWPQLGVTALWAAALLAAGAYLFRRRDA